jgi:hypothetical protein
MNSELQFEAFGMFAFLMSFILLAAAIVLLVLGGTLASVQMSMFSVAWNALGLLNVRIGAHLGAQANRLDKLEAELRQRATG